MQSTIVLNSVTMLAVPTPERIWSILRAVRSLQVGRTHNYIALLILLGKFTAASTVVPLGLLWLRPFKQWLIHICPIRDKYKKIRVTHHCMRSLAPWSQEFLIRGVPLGPSPARWEVIRTDSSPHLRRGVWRKRGMNGTHWRGALRTAHINVPEWTLFFFLHFFTFKLFSGENMFWCTQTTRWPFLYQPSGRHKVKCPSGSSQPACFDPCQPAVHPNSISTSPTQSDHGRSVAGCRRETGLYIQKWCKWYWGRIGPWR